MDTVKAVVRVESDEFDPMNKIGRDDTARFWANLSPDGFKRLDESLRRTFGEFAVSIKTSHRHVIRIKFSNSVQVQKWADVVMSAVLEERIFQTDC